MNNISIFNFMKLPEIITRIHSSEVVSFGETIPVCSEEYSTMLIMLSGSGEYLSAGGKNTEQDFPNNYMLFLPPKEKVLISPATQVCKVLQITFDILATNDINTDTDSDINTPCKQVNFKKIQSLIGCFPVSYYEEHYPYFAADISGLIALCRSEQVDTAALRYTLDKVMFTVLRVQYNAALNILREINAVAISNADKESHASFRFSVTPVEIWTGDPDTDADAQLYLRAEAENTYIELPLSGANRNLEFNADREEDYPEKYCTFSQSSGQRFKLWLFPKQPAVIRDSTLTPNYIVFRIKSNQVTGFLLSLFHVPSYRNICYRFSVEKPDTWISFKIPVSESNSLNAMSAYVEKAIRYIQDNYSEKLTIKGIADHVRIHPSYLSVMFRKNLNQSVNSYINSYRIAIAKQLLSNSDLSITDVALQTGFYDAQHFLKNFKKSTGLTPTQFRNSR